MDVVFQTSLPFAPWTAPHAWRLPGTMPLDPADWLVADDAFAAQMVVRDRLIATRPREVTAALPDADREVAELFDRVLAHLPALGHEVRKVDVLRPDGAVIPLDRGRPLETLGRLCQEDFCLLRHDTDGEPILSAAVLCFPAGWRLAQKLGRGLGRIHAPVTRYDDDVRRRVARLFAALRPDRPLWRANAHWSGAPLFNPRDEGAPAPVQPTDVWIRSERQCLLRLPETGAVVFSIHTWLVRQADLTPDQGAALAGARLHHAP
jgi:dimethylamine monooxygenase subunit A